MQELSHWQEISPFHGLILTEDPKVDFQFLVNLFRLTIGLGMIDSGEGNVI